MKPALSGAPVLPVAGGGVLGAVGTRLTQGRAPRAVSSLLSKEANETRLVAHVFGDSLSLFPRLPRVLSGRGNHCPSCLPGHLNFKQDDDYQTTEGGLIKGTVAEVPILLQSVFSLYD